MYEVQNVNNRLSRFPTCKINPFPTNRASAIVIGTHPVILAFVMTHPEAYKWLFAARLHDI